MYLCCLWKAKMNNNLKKVMRFRFIKEIYIDYGKVPLKIRNDAEGAIYHNDITRPYNRII